MLSLLCVLLETKGKYGKMEENTGKYGKMDHFFTYNLLFFIDLL